MASLTPAEAADLIRDTPAVNITVATTALGVSVATGSRLIAAGTFPVPVIRMGSRVVIPTPPLRKLLGIEPGTDAA